MDFFDYSLLLFLVLVILVHITSGVEQILYIAFAVVAFVLLSIEFVRNLKK
jgi:hypothetical protein